MFFTKLEHKSFLGLLATSQVALDPFPWGGGVTTLDAFAAGTPVVTYPKQQTGVQLAAGFYRYMGIADCIVASVQEYVDLAVEIAMNPSTRERISASILKRHYTIFEDASTAKEWERFLLQISR